jgi:DNA-directed RNA polymerase subunit K/omega
MEYGLMVIRPTHLNAYQFVVVSALRAQQLLAGSTPRMAGSHTPATMAQMEVAEGLVMASTDTATLTQCRWQL